MKTRNDLFNVYTQPSDTFQRLGKAIRRFFQVRTSKRRA